MAGKPIARKPILIVVGAHLSAEVYDRPLAYRLRGRSRLAAAEDMDLFRRLSRIGRTRFESRLTVYHTGRRAHAVSATGTPPTPRSGGGACLVGH